MNTDDVIFNYFKLICDEKDDSKCVSLGKDWISAMEKNLLSMNDKLEKEDKINHENDIIESKKYLDSLKHKSAQQWREYATHCMIEILDNDK